MLNYDASSRTLFHPEHAASPLLVAAPPHEDALACEAARLAYLRWEAQPAERERLQQALACAGFDGLRCFEHAPTDGQGFGALRAADGLVLLAFRGTQADRPRDLAIDARFRPVPWSLGRDDDTPAVGGDAGMRPFDGDVQTSPGGGDTPSRPFGGDVRTSPVGAQVPPRAFGDPLQQRLFGGPLQPRPFGGPLQPRAFGGPLQPRPFGRVHAGFAATALGLWDEVQPWLAETAPRRRRLLVCGHSLGGAIATLLALPAGADRLLTIGSPRVGDAAFVARLLAQVPDVRRFANCCDVVARVPPPLGFRHAGARRYIDRHGHERPGIGRLAVFADRSAARAAHVWRHAWRPGHVPLRMLADHAPHNYLRALWPTLAPGTVRGPGDPPPR